MKTFDNKQNATERIASNKFQASCIEGNAIHWMGILSFQLEIKIKGSKKRLLIYLPINSEYKLNKEIIEKKIEI